MIDHLTLKVRDLAVSKPFYVKALEPLGYSVQMEFEGTCGMGPPGKPALWITQGGSLAPMHIAFEARDRAAVDAFHAAATGVGGRDNGPPGVREQYHPSYYGAFVFDPDGNNIEAVCHVAPSAAKRSAPRKARGPARVGKKPAATPRRGAAGRRPAAKRAKRRTSR